MPLRIGNLSFGGVGDLRATVYFFGGDLVIDRSTIPIPPVRCQLAVPVGTSRICQATTPEPAMGRFLPHNRRHRSFKVLSRGIHLGIRNTYV